ncbi:hypothetical protein [Nocardia salmonicida]|uniref:hypothetical protein n=1 Tax=Nocardia salmonicida TaxID=53431 RepID=UPI002E2E5DB3|nr:hypothetical protein [Nocardia salmonicida]
MPWEHIIPSEGETPVLYGTTPTSWYTPPDNRQHIAYIDTHFQIHECHFAYAPGGYHWEHNVPSAGHVKVSPNPPVGFRQGITSWYTPSDTRQHVAYVGEDSQIHECHFAYAPGGYHWEHGVPSAGHTPVRMGASPTSWYTPVDNAQHIAYVGTDDLIHECYFRYAPGGYYWEHIVPSAGFTPVVAGEAGDSPTSWYTPSDTRQHIAYVGTDYLIHECHFRYPVEGSHWEHSLPSAGHTEARIDNSPTSWYTPVDNAQHIAYVGTDYLIHECYFRYPPGGNHWEHIVPSAGHTPVRTGASPTSWYTPSDTRQHIAYVGADDLIHECHFRYPVEGSHWEHGLPSAGHTPVKEYTGPTSWYTPIDNAQHIAYVGTDYRIHECYFRL